MKLGGIGRFHLVAGRSLYHVEAYFCLDGKTEFRGKGEKIMLEWLPRKKYENFNGSEKGKKQRIAGVSIIKCIFVNI